MKQPFLTTGATLLFLFATGGVPLSVRTADAATTDSLQTQIEANTQEVLQLNQEIAKYEAEIKQAGADKKTLQDAINALNLERRKIEAQVSATQHQINVTQLQIKQLGSSIADTQEAVAADQAALGEDVRSLQQADNQPLIVQLFASASLGQVWADVDNTLQVQDAIHGKIETLQAQQDKLAASQAASEQKRSTLTVQKQALGAQQQSLSAAEKSKSRLLTETGAKEANYERLLAQAKAELASFSTFASNAGGSGLLSNQTSCDAWGCYYNQRDAAWGNDPLNGTQYLLKSDGCLVTSMAMVMTHYGYRDVTPVSINANPSNFASYYPAYLLFTINVDGVTAARKAAAIDATLATGNPVIAGIHVYGGTHYVVLTSGSKGAYRMRDPYLPDGKDISFAAHYSLKNIFGISKVEIGG